ncbi:thiamine pyrophosphate-binding protein [Arthrobacter mobilis]|uniref:Thiamine pyrophosphate-binding protein n=2 Tax=Arthrobacter mobilis TaxID=2724944 RepID=A0A7X6K6M1_9MICC|nr:thiamine pyrophosphate-binding protein [Arthrobacter mobilis]
MRVFEKVAETLVELGVKQVFGVIGSGNYDITKALIERGADYVAARHEGGAASMADAFARIGDSVPAISLHQGCGLTNAITGITEAAKSGSPMLILAAEVAASAIHSNFRIGQDRLVESVGAASFRITAETAARDIALAYRTAVTKRIPVLVNLPLDVQAAETTEQYVPVLTEHAVLADAAAPAAEDVARLADLIERAERPVVLAGRGGRGAGLELRELAEVSGALLATSAVARGLFNDDPFYLDISGGFSTPLAARSIQAADLILSFGSALNMWTMRHGTLIGPGATVVQIDVDPLAPGKHRPVDLGILGDAALTAAAVTAELRGRGLSRIGYRTEEMGAAIKREGRWQDVPFDDRSTAERIDPRTLTIVLDGMLDKERVIAVDSGNFLGYPSAFLDIPDENGLVFSQAFQCVGLGLASAIGAAYAQPDRLPVCGTGDGGALMAAAEMESVVRLGIPMVVIVYNDSAYGAEVHHFGESDQDLGLITFPDTDFAAIARGYGFTAATVRTAADLEPVRDWLAGPRNTPLLIDAKIVSFGSWWLEEAFKGH